MSRKTLAIVIFACVLINAGLVSWGMGLIELPAGLFGVRSSSDSLLAQVSPGVNEALFEILPANSAISLNGTFSVNLKISASAGVTSLKAYLDFPASLLQVQSINLTNSVFATPWENDFDNTAGKVKLQLSLPSPGFQGSNGLVATVNFRGVGAGNGSITYDASSLALKDNDENILNIANSVEGAITVDGSAPARSSGQPTGELAYTTTSATLSLATNENATCKYSLASGTAYGSMTGSFSATGAISHSTVVTGLAAGNNYTYYIRCIDGVGNLNSTDYPITFSVAGMSDIDAPLRSGGLPAGELAATTTSTSISLATNENAICKYSTISGTGYDVMAGTFSATGATSHSTTVSGLIAASAYTYYVRCADAPGNKNANDYPISFSIGVLPPPDTTAPMRSNNQPTGQLASTVTSAILSLSTNENATCRYSTSAGIAYDSMVTSFSATGGIAHSTDVFGLSAGNSYTYYVRCTDGYGNKNGDDFPMSFAVASVADTTSPSLSGGQPAGNLAAGTASTNISLSTNEDATCKYATSAGVQYDSMGNTFTATGARSHSVFVSGLSNGSGYAYYVRCTDAVGNKSASDFVIEFSVLSSPVQNPSSPGGPSGPSGPSGPLSTPTPTPTSSGNATLSSKKGDLNGDGKVNIFDLSILFSHWKEKNSAFDISGDKTVDIIDLSIIFSNWSSK